jgi:hypothetical protein
MPAEEQLCTISDVVDAWAPFAQVNPTEQAKLIDTASGKILKFCRRAGFIQETMNEFIDGNNLTRVWLSRRPVLNVFSLTINGILLQNTTGLEWGFNAKTGEFWRHTGHHDIRFGRFFPKGRQNIQVGYFAGFGEVPSEINRAAIFLVKYLREQIRVSGVYSSESIGDYSYSLNAQAVGMGGLPSHVAAMCMDFVADDAFA